MLSVAILAKNESKNIVRCLKSVKFADEILVILDRSNDETEAICRSLGARIIKASFDNSFSRRRNLAMIRSRGNWILFIDADEEVTPQLSLEVRRVEGPTYEQKFTCFTIRRRDFFWGQELKYGEIRKVYRRGLIRLVKKNSGKWIGNVHEEFVPKGRVGVLRSWINHYPHPTIVDFLENVNLYSSIRAAELHEAKKRTNLFEIILFPLGKFLMTYLILQGFRDGSAGFAYSFMMSFHSFLVRAKLYLLSISSEKSNFTVES